MKKCHECGTFSSDETVFCHVCGKRFPNTLEKFSDSSNSECQEAEGVVRIGFSVPTHPEIAPLLQRIELFLEDGEFDRADEYCERVLDMEPLNAEAYIDKLLIEFNCGTCEQLRNSTTSIADSKNYAKVIRFGNDSQKAFVIETENKIQKNMEILAERVENAKLSAILDENQNPSEIEIDETEEYFIDIYCPYCYEKLSYTNWQVKEGILTCPMCDAQFEFDEKMRI